MAKFIEVTIISSFGGENKTFKTSINIEKIEAFADITQFNIEECNTRIDFSGDTSYKVNETYEQVKEMINA